METLVAADHRDQSYSRVKTHSPVRFGSLPSKHFTEINCRTFQCGADILPTPFNRSIVTKQGPSSPKTPFENINSYASSHFGDNICSNTTLKSSPIPIGAKAPRKETPNEELLPFSELWAGPTYSNSPPPSSLPIPKFSLKPKRTASLDFPAHDSGIEVHVVAKSAPVSPTREYDVSSSTLFLHADSATKILRHILNLDGEDD
ncbi:hypothetical protein K2173_025457 [Erythroxylum novogranatense]|uniref:Uncharacterized protein n=1 Tax=Erythroxylum novogranatense TaxID=1862640 RepID=A0AAV8SB63_9ROSI|nr:hypothetical protein K2173_025457 [Erythroxylum novogranatense]